MIDRPKVLILYKYVPQYRAVFFERLRDRLSRDGIELTLVYGNPNRSESKKNDAAHLPWAIYLPNHFFAIAGRTLVYQPALALSAHFDLVIVEQASKLLLNFALIALDRIGRRRVAYWGHGRDFQGEDNSFERALKDFLIRRVSWWFPYNRLSAATIAKAGFPSKCTTLVMNTIDTDILMNQLQQVTDRDLLTIQVEAGGHKSANVCIFIGSMYPEKRLGFLLEACKLIRVRVPDFQILLLGSGVDEPIVANFCKKHDWAFWAGPAFGADKARYLKSACLLLMPGLVGLAVIDSFVAGVPIVTTAVDYHSPEIDYLESGHNGVMVQNTQDPIAYAEVVAELLHDKSKIKALQVGCHEAARQYTMDNMVENFALGVESALSPGDQRCRS